jgi:hypothetical protein
LTVSDTDPPLGTNGQEGQYFESLIQHGLLSGFRQTVKGSSHQLDADSVEMLPSLAFEICRMLDMVEDKERFVMKYLLDFEMLRTVANALKEMNKWHKERKWHTYLMLPVVKSGSHYWLKSR